MRKLVVILGVPIDNYTMAETLDRLEELVAIGRQSGRSHQVATVNTDFIVKSLRDPELRYLLQDADLAMPDGMPLVWGARALGVPLAERVAGSDLVPLLAERAAERGFSVYLLGAAPGVAATAAELLRERYPGVNIVGVNSPPYRSVLEMDSSLVTEINAAKPDILLVAFGNPKQEKWIGMYREQLRVPVMIGVGAALDFVAGHRRRAPEWMQRTGLEWLYRLCQEPRRLWRRYVVDLVGFGTFFAWQWWYVGRGHRPATALPASELVLVNRVAVVNLTGRITLENSATLHAIGQEALAVSSNVLVNLERVEFIDSSAIGTLVELTRQARARGGDCWLAAVPPVILQTLLLMRLDAFFNIVETVNTVVERGQGTSEKPSVKQNGAAPAGSSARWTVLRVPRQLDARTSPAFAENGLATLREHPYLILDFSETVFLSSAGLAILAQLHRTAGELQGKLRVASCNRDVLRVIDMVRFDKLLALYDTVAAAEAE